MLVDEESQGCVNFGGLVDFLNYIIMYDEKTELFSVYSDSFPEYVIVKDNETAALKELKTLLSNLTVW